MQIPIITKANGEEEEEAKRPWPEVEFLFGEDENYQDIVSEIMKSVTLSITQITSYIEVFCLNKILYNFRNKPIKIIELRTIISIAIWSHQRSN
jgi:hypothetical protein